jgi:hypothetical protein
MRDTLAYQAITPRLPLVEMAERRAALRAVADVLRMRADRGPMVVVVVVGTDAAAFRALVETAGVREATASPST